MPDMTTFSDFTDFDVSVNATHSKLFPMLDASSESMFLVPHSIANSMLLGKCQVFCECIFHFLIFCNLRLDILNTFSIYLCNLGNA